MSNTYRITDTRVCVNSEKTKHIRLNATVGDNGASAMQWLGDSVRVTDFSEDEEQRLRINEFLVDLIDGDDDMLADMDDFIKYQP